MVLGGGTGQVQMKTLFPTNISTISPIWTLKEAILREWGLSAKVQPRGHLLTCLILSKSFILDKACSI